jgi:hypothetical protein
MFLDQSPPPIGIPMHDQGVPVTISVKCNILDQQDIPKQFFVNVHTHDAVGFLRLKISEKLKVWK